MGERDHSDSAAPVSRPPTIVHVSAPDPGSADGYRPPSLPPVTTGVWHIAIPGTIAWLVAFVVLLFFIPELRANDAMVWLWTCLAGFVTGLLGLSVYGWQRRAARLGKRSANQMALNERF
jgi:hypothetical protein